MTDKEGGQGRYADLEQACEAVPDPCLSCVLAPEGLHCFDNVADGGDIEDLKTILRLAAVMVCNLVDERQGAGAVIELLRNIRMDCE